MSLNPLEQSSGGGGSGGDSTSIGVTGFADTSTVQNFPFVRSEPI